MLKRNIIKFFRCCVKNGHIIIQFCFLVLYMFVYVCYVIINWSNLDCFDVRLPCITECRDWWEECSDATEHVVYPAQSGSCGGDCPHNRRVSSPCGDNSLHHLCMAAKKNSKYGAYRQKQKSVIYIFCLGILSEGGRVRQKLWKHKH